MIFDHDQEVAPFGLREFVHTGGFALSGLAEMGDSPLLRWSVQPPPRSTFSWLRRAW